jgi:ectoine hydroxylase
MQLSQPQIEAYNKNGYLLIENVFDQAATNTILQEMQKVIAEDCPRRILEKNGEVRSFFAPEVGSSLFEEIIRLEKLVTPSSQLVGNKIYAHQTKLNTKHALVGDWWEWHQDYTFWKNDDGMPQPNVVTAMIFLNEITEFNGPLFLIPGTHKMGVLDDNENEKSEEDIDTWFGKYKRSTSYITALTADLKYTLKQRTIAQWAEKNGIFSAKGPAGSVLFFHGNTFHSSGCNLSPWDRHTFLISYNDVNNSLPDIPNPRPDFIANSNFSPIIPTKSLILG